MGADGNDDLGYLSGSAYIFTKGVDGTWLQSAKLWLPTVLKWTRLAQAFPFQGTPPLWVPPTTTMGAVIAVCVYLH